MVQSNSPNQTDQETARSPGAVANETPNGDTSVQTPSPLGGFLTGCVQQLSQAAHTDITAKLIESPRPTTGVVFSIVDGREFVYLSPESVPLAFNFIIMSQAWIRSDWQVVEKCIQYQKEHMPVGFEQKRRVKAAMLRLAPDFCPDGKVVTYAYAR